MNGGCCGEPAREDRIRLLEDYQRDFERRMADLAEEIRHPDVSRERKADVTDVRRSEDPGMGGLPQARRAAVEIFDPPMCCPTGLCGPTLDQALLDVEAMLLELQAQGHRVERYQMTSHPQAFTQNAEVMALVRERHLDALPITVVGNQVIKTGAYPSAAEVQAALEGERDG